MKRILKHLFIAAICTTIGTSIWLYRANILFPVQPVPFEPKPQTLKSTDLMAPPDMMEDFAFLVEVIESVHPNPFNRLGEEGWEETKAAVKNRLKEHLTASQYFFALNSVVTAVGDAHTLLRFEEQDKALPLSFLWAGESLVISEDHGPFARGDLVLSMGGKTPAELLLELEQLVSSENIYRVRDEAKTLLLRRPFLEYLGLVQNEEVLLVLEREGAFWEIPAKFQVKRSRERELEELLENPHQWHIEPEHDLASFQINVCIYDSVFENDVKDFFAAVREQSISRVVIDVRENIGGDSRVLGSIMRHLPIDGYITHGTHIRYSRLAAERAGMRKTRGSSTFAPSQRKVQTVEEPYEGDVFVLTGNRTFSSGNWIATAFHDNQLATIMGEPTGNSPSSFGDMLSFQLPASRFILGVSYKHFPRPDPSLDPQNSLYPHITIERTLRDIIHNIDPVMTCLRRQ